MPYRNVVYDAIGTERDYQDAVWVKRSLDAGLDPVPDEELSVAEFLVFMQGYYNELVYGASHKVGFQTLDWVRKLAGLGFACMEVHGAIDRDGNHCKGPLSFAEVVNVVNVERSYQDSLSNDRTDNPGLDRPLLDYVLMYGDYLDRARAAWTDNAGDSEALKVVPKLTAICVKAMEAHGAPKRPAFVIDIE